MEVNRDGELTMTFSGPDIINGVGITVVGETVIINVRGVTERYDRSTVPEGSPALYLYDILFDLDGKSPKTINDNITVSGTTAEGNYTVTLNSTGFIDKAELDATGVEIIFYNCVATN